MVSKALNVGLRAWQLLCTVIVMALIGNIIARATNGTSAMVNYDMFVAVFAMLSLFYLLPTTILDSFNVPVVYMALDVLNVIFWFCAAVATAAYLGVHSCSNSKYTLSNHITNSSRDTQKNCRQAQASTAFFWFGWAAFVGSMVVSIMGGRGNVNMRGSIRSGSSRPAMSQV